MLIVSFLVLFAVRPPWPFEAHSHPCLATSFPSISTSSACFSTCPFHPLLCCPLLQTHLFSSFASLFCTFPFNRLLLYPLYSTFSPSFFSTSLSFPLVPLPPVPRSGLFFFLLYWFLLLYRSQLAFSSFFRTVSCPFHLHLFL